jgi:hypothetical protein
MALEILFLTFGILAATTTAKETRCEALSRYTLSPVELPQPDSHSAVGQIFDFLHNTKNILQVQNEHSKCYKWRCKSKARAGRNCTYCLPSVFVAGFSKCGTTALCSKLALHPEIKPYRKKEINIFTKFPATFSWEAFEKRVEDTDPTVRCRLSFLP